jgi:uncharacterized protein YbjT (DUF2867 family)
MKFVITGSLGNISKPLAQSLIAAGHQVTVISSQPERVKDIEAIGAAAAIGAISDAAFLTETFRGADAVYTMVPPSHTTNNYREYYNQMAKSYSEAIKASGVKRVVNLSSIGAHLPDGTGPIKGLYDLEAIFNTLEDVAIVHLRPASFYTNMYGNVAMIKQAGIMGGNYPATTTVIMVHPADIADTAAAMLQQPFSGKSVQYIASDELTMAEATAMIGAAIGKPELSWVAFSDEQAYAGMLQAGLSEEMARNFVEMGSATRAGILWEDYHRNRPQLSSRKFSDFAREFALAF